jgi:hypothetical protein
MPEISEQVWRVIDKYKGDIAIKSLPSIVLEELFDELNWVQIFTRPVLEQGSEDTVSNKIIDYTLNVAKTYIKDEDRILWYLGDRGRASSYKVGNSAGLIPIDCYYKNKEDFSYSRRNRTVPGRDLLTIDPRQYTVLIANYIYFDNEPEILEIFSQMSSDHKVLLYCNICPDETDSLYEGSEVHEVLNWSPDADAVRNGFKILTKPTNGRVRVWCRHGKQDDAIWSARKGHYSFPMYEMTQRIEKGGFNHTALKHFMFTIFDPKSEVKKFYTYPKDHFEARVRNSFLYHHDTVESVPLSLPDNDYMCCFQVHSGKTFIKFFDIDIEVPYFVRYRYLSRFVQVYNGPGGMIDPMASYQEVKMGFMTKPGVVLSPIIFFGYGWNYALDAMVFDESKEGMLIFNTETSKEEPEWKDCDFDGTNFSIVSKGRYKVYFPQSFSLDLTDGNFRLEKKGYYEGEGDTGGYETSITGDKYEEAESPDKVLSIEEV